MIYPVARGSHAQDSFVRVTKQPSQQAKPLTAANVLPPFLSAGKGSPGVLAVVSQAAQKWWQLLGKGWMTPVLQQALSLCDALGCSEFRTETGFGG